MIYRFKTNINCGGCIASVSPYLNSIENTDWKVDTETPERILTVETKTVDEQFIMNLVKKAGFEIEKA